MQDEKAMILQGKHCDFKALVLYNSSGNISSRISQGFGQRRVKIIDLAMLTAIRPHDEARMFVEVWLRKKESIHERPYSI